MIRIAVVDDDAMVRTALKLILGGEPDLSILWEAGDGAQALEQLESMPVDILLMDIRMPVMDGLTLLEQLRDRTDAPKTIILTTFNTDDYVRRGLTLGAAGFVLKDSGPQELIDAIHRVHGGEPSLSSAVTQTLIDIARSGAPAGPPQPSAMDTLTAREREIAVCMMQGFTNTQIASRLSLSPASVKAHVSRIFGKLGVDNRVSAAMLLRGASGMWGPQTGAGPR